MRHRVERWVFVRRFRDIKSIEGTFEVRVFVISEGVKESDVVAFSVDGWGVGHCKPERTDEGVDEGIILE